MKPTNASKRSREYLLELEVEQLIAVAKANKNTLLATRNHLIILLGYRHGLRVSELISLKWNQVDIHCARLHIKRLKNSNSGVHPLAADECPILKKLKKHQPLKSNWIFATKFGIPITRDGVAKAVAIIAQVARLEIPFHHHMLRHGCGYELAKKGFDTRLIQEYLGYKSIQHTVLYTALDSERFNKLSEK
jgi:site-specific recombinase XerD